MSSLARPPAEWRMPLVVIVVGCLIAAVGFGVRSAFGLFLEPMTLAHGWPRETFALALAVQNLMWGFAVPIAGALADRYGPARVLGLGALIYGAGVWGMAEAESGELLLLTGGVLTGLGIGLSSFSLALAAMTKAVRPERRSLALGLGTAAGSAGQVIFSPIAQALIAGYGWYEALLVFAGSAFFILLVAQALPRGQGEESTGRAEQTIIQALREASVHRGYVLLAIGFFVCGFHVAFITVHFPAYVCGLGLEPEVGAWSLSLIGLFNIVGAFVAGLVGQRWSKKAALSTIYFARAVVIAALLVAPKTEATVLAFAGAMGLLWLATVPLTSGIVMQVFGVRYLATLFGVVFLSHQLGSFVGVWLGGVIYDLYGVYDPMWWVSIALGLAAALVHLPIDERPLARLGTQATR